MSRIPVLIPSKGRYNTKAYKLFDDKCFKVYHFIEPNEINLYGVPNIVNIEKNNNDKEASLVDKAVKKLEKKCLD